MSGSNVVPIPGGVYTVTLDSSALPIPVSGSFTAQTSFNYNGASGTVAVYSASAASANIGLPVLLLSGQGAAPVGQTTPLAIRLSDGTDFIVAGAIAAAQKTAASATKALDVVAFGLGWDGTTHREIATDTSGNQKIVNVASFIPAVFDYVSADRSASASNVWTYKTGGAGGPTVKTVTVTYSDTSKSYISSIAAT
jgi:hypothetical protein